jgi:glyoxylase-like metal-dependent hydrolase (beta-lactamase superfamily II)
MALTWMDTDLRRIRAQNPSALTGSGTNTYLLGRGQVVVIDPGPDLGAHLTAILGALEPGESIAAIFVTHCHLDHCALAARLAKTVGAPIFGFGPAQSGRSALMHALVQDGLPGGGESFDLAFAPDRLVRDGESLAFGPLHIAAHHTPGHTGCHMSFSHGGRLFCGDHIMGWSTSLISPPDGDMACYIKSLQRLQTQDWSHGYPGHGEPVAAPQARIAELVMYRLTREAAVLAALTAEPRTVADLTREIYADTATHLWPAAERNLLAHLIKLWHEGQVTTASTPSLRAVFAKKL